LDDTYAINVAKSEYREGFNTGDAARVLGVFASEYTDMALGRPSRYGSDAPLKLRGYLEELFERYQAALNVIIIRIAVVGSTAYDYGWHELTLMPKAGGEVIYRRTRYLEVWLKQSDGQWRISLFMDNADLPDTVD
jgi:ketosteroid isomerase-like protein